MQEDESYLNKRGLTHFWENIDALKQDKLTAGANITIASDNTISASQPTVNNATLTIQKEGTSVGTFTANASTNSTVNIIETDPTVPAWAKASSKPSYSWTEITNKPTIPTKTSDLTNDSGFLTSTDYATASTGGVIKVGGGLEITNGVLSATGGGTADAVEWANVLNRPSDVSYWTNDAGYITSADLPTVGNATLTIQKNGTSAGTFTANATSNETINITVPTTAADVSALPASTKYGASIAVSINTTDYKVTTTLKDQDGNTLGTAQVIDLPLESVVVNGSYDNTNKKIVLTLQSGSTIDIPVADLVAGLQSEITSTNKLASDLVDDTNQTNKFMTSAEKTKLSGIATGAEVNVQSDWSQTDNTADDYIKNKPTLATVATSGSYNDLSNKPTIPTVNNATLTIQKNGTNVQTFTANQSTNATANITVPTKTSDITNDSGFITSSSLDSYLPLSGGILTGNVGINELDNGGTYFHVKDSSQGTALSFGVGSGHVNHGIWSNTLNKWMLYGDATNVYLNGNATTATTATKANQLTNARTIALGTGATGTATSFNGTSNITIPVTDVKDAYVTWGGKSLTANVTPDDMGCIDEFGHNKLAFLPAECITVEYTTDGGTTWTDYGATDAQKIRMVSTTGTSFMAGGPSAVPTADNITDFKVRVRVASMTPSGTSKLYSAMVKCLLNITTNGASGTKVAIRSRTVANYKAGVDTWVDRGEFDIGGWSGWNSIPFNYTFGGTSDSQLAQFEFVFWGTGKHTSYNSKVAVIDIRMIGRTNWTTPSEMARAGHLYTVNESQDATFPAKVIAPKIETGTGANNYFQSQKFRGQGDASSYYHAIDFGYGGHDQVDFYEYGGVWNFWRNTGGTATTADSNMALGITIDALKNKGYTYTFPNKTGTFALTSDIPTVPTNVSAFTNDAGYLTSIPTASASTLGGIKVGSGLSISNGVLSTNATAPDWSDITNKPTFATVATSGSYNDLSNKPTIPAAQVQSDWTQTTTTAVDYIKNKPNLATVATSGSYNDLSNKPTIPTVNNGTLTIQKNGTNVQTFTANQSGNATANITVPTAVSELNNDSGYQTAAQVQTAVDGKQDELTAGDHINITNDVISATDYVHSENPVSTTAVTPIVTGSMISNGTITADKLATGATIQLTLSTTDIGEGAALAANTLYGVYQ